MTVRDLIKELLDYEMDDDVYVSIDNKEKIGNITNLSTFRGMCIIHYDNWEKHPHKKDELSSFYSPDLIRQCDMVAENVIKGIEIMAKREGDYEYIKR